MHHRRSIRLKHYNYSQAGAYFVTICTKDKEWLFGDVINMAMQLNDMGTAARECWNAISQHCPNVVLDEFIVMPNHIHGIIILNVGAKNLSLLQNDAKDISAGLNNGISNRAKDISPLRGTSMTIGSVIRGFKIGVTKWARNNAFAHTPWQRNYYERIIRNEPELFTIREYIINNPLNWEKDENYYK